jgi:hypothetical protein
MKQPWIRSPLYDSVWILGPGLAPVLLIILFPSFFRSQSAELSTISWVILVLLIDVAHVYSTVYRTYLNKTSRNQFRTLFNVTPLICWITGILIYSVNDLLFWRCLAYLAVFHFVRQQYGFMRIYSRQQYLPQWIRKTHSVTIYSVTVLPVLIWHSEGQKNFNWFIKNDFIYFNSPFLATAFTILFFSCILVYFLTEALLFLKFRQINIPRLLFVTGTALSWYIGIVVYDGDLSFTLLNVVAHGIPYMALIWTTEQKQAITRKNGVFLIFFRSYGIIFFLGLLFTLAFIEEGLWDALIWREQSSVFQSFYFLPPVSQNKVLCFLIPLLTLPQTVHYILDGFIWKNNTMK